MLERLQRLLLGAGVESTPPERVARLIAEREIESERLIAAAQLLIGCVWTALYILAPKTFAVERTFAPVPVALVLYIGFSLLRLMLLRRAFAPPWFLALSVFFDMALLMGLIWSFHLQYGQPAAFYLKAPTLLYVFIFVALRGLRFSAGYVLLAGGTAALGWLALLQYALLTSEAPGMSITNDYVAYMTSAKVLIGAEFDKIIAILLTTAILALALMRARRLLVAAVSEEAAHRDLERFFAPEIANHITHAEDRILPGRGEMREAAVLVTDIRGFTRLAMTSDPDQLMAILAEYQRRMVSVIQAHGGSIDKFLGDGILATFGVSDASETTAADALYSLEALLQEAEDWRAARRARGLTPLEIGFAVAVGPVVFGAVGDDSRLEFTVIGEPVNLAAKLEKQNKVEGARAMTTAETLARAEAEGFRPALPPEHLPARTVEGVESPVDLVVLA